MGPKMPHLHHYRHNSFFSRKIGFAIFKFIEPKLYAKNQKEITLQTGGQTDGWKRKQSKFREPSARARGSKRYF